MKMSLSLKSFVLVICLYVGIIFAQQPVRNKNYACSTWCHCRNTKVRCNFTKSNHSDINFLIKSIIKNVSGNISELDLSGNHITEWEKGVFEGFDHLSKLNLSSNPISKLAPNAFKGLKNLKTLDLSNTEITELKNGTFTGLQGLDRLILLETRLQLISENSLEELTAINRLDVQSEMLTCDCRLKWFSNWLRSRKIQEEVLCGLPSELKDRRVKGLESELVRCGFPLELTPSNDQVIFEGDNFPMKCLAAVIDSSMNFSWLHNGKSIFNSEDGVSSSNIKLELSSEKNVKFATLELTNVDVSFNGVWTCRFGSGDSFVSKTIKIMVLERTSAYCPPSNTFDNKGNYAWPSTLAGAVKVLPCVVSIEYSGMQNLEVMKAYRACDQGGLWNEPDTSRCPYVSEVTRMLGETASLNLSLPDVTVDNVLKTFHSLGPQTSDGATIHDHTEICFLAKILEQLSAHSKKFEKIAVEVVVGLVNLSMNVSPNVLIQAQQMDKCCSRILKALENTITSLLLLDASHLTLTSRNVAVQGYKVTSKNAKGIACGSEAFSRNQTSNVSLVCEETLTEILGPDIFKEHQSFMFIPIAPLSAAIHHSNDNKGHDNHLVDNMEDGAKKEGALIVIIISLRDPRLFPILEETAGVHGLNNSSTKSDESGEQGDVGVVSGPVLLTNIVSFGLRFNSSPSIVLTIKNPTKKFTLTQAKWKTLPDGGGRWSRGDCTQEVDANKILEITDDDDDEDDNERATSGHSVVKFTCRSPGAFAVTLRPLHFPILTQVLKGLREMNPLVYISCLTLFVISSIIIVIYIIHWRRIEMSPKTRHAVLNLNVSLALLVAVFALGVKMHRVLVACQISTIFLHYFSLSTQVWITIISFKLLHMMTRCSRNVPLESEEKKPKAKPLAPEYLLGWGVPIIVCGIGSAINWDDQSAGFARETEVCFLNKSATILMFFLPSAIIILINLVIFIKISRSRHGCHHSGDDVDEGNRQNSLECGTRPSSSASSSSSSYPPFSSHGVDTHSYNTTVGANENQERQRLQTNFPETNRRLLHLLNEGVVGVSSSNIESCHRECADKSFMPSNVLESSLATSEMKTEASSNFEFRGFGTIYPVSSQLCGSAAMILLYCATWTTGMLAVIKDPPRVFSGGFNGDFFRIMFLALSLSLSSFMAVYFCIGRRDVRKAICDRRGSTKRFSFVAVTSREEIWHLRDSIIEQGKAKKNHQKLPQSEHRAASFKVELFGLGSANNNDNSAEVSDVPHACKSVIVADVGPPNVLVSDRTESEDPPNAKLSVVVDSRSSVVFYDPRQNGAAKRYWEKARRKRSRVQSSGGSHVTGNEDVADDQSDEEKGYSDLKNAPTTQMSQQKSFKPQQIFNPYQLFQASSDTHGSSCTESQNRAVHHPQCFLNRTTLSDSERDNNVNQHVQQKNLLEGWPCLDPRNCSSAHKDFEEKFREKHNSNDNQHNIENNNDDDDDDDDGTCEMHYPKNRSFQIFNVNASFDTNHDDEGCQFCPVCSNHFIGHHYCKHGNANNGHPFVGQSHVGQSCANFEGSNFEEVWTDRNADRCSPQCRHNHQVQLKDVWMKK